MNALPSRMAQKIPAPEVSCYLNYDQLCNPPSCAVVQTLEQALDVANSQSAHATFRDLSELEVEDSLRADAELMPACMGTSDTDHERANYFYCLKHSVRTLQ